jgi:excisionase family DNA binding protein
VTGHTAHWQALARHLAPVPPPQLAIDFEPLVDQVVARLRPLLNADGEARPPKRAFRTPEVARLLSISDSEVRELVALGELESITIGRIRLVPLSAIDEFLERKLAAARSAR